MKKQNKTYVRVKKQDGIYFGYKIQWLDQQLKKSCQLSKNFFFFHIIYLAINQFRKFVIIFCIISAHSWSRLLLDFLLIATDVSNSVLMEKREVVFFCLLFIKMCSRPVLMISTDAKRKGSAAFNSNLKHFKFVRPSL